MSEGSRMRIFLFSIENRVIHHVAGTPAHTSKPSSKFPPLNFSRGAKHNRGEYTKAFVQVQSLKSMVLGDAGYIHRDSMQKSSGGSRPKGSACSPEILEQFSK
jgi:hypothetical protein